MRSEEVIGTRRKRVNGNRNRNGIVYICYIVISFLTLVLGLEEISDESKQVTS